MAILGGERNSGRADMWWSRAAIRLKARGDQLIVLLILIAI